MLEIAGGILIALVALVALLAFLPAVFVLVSLAIVIGGFAFVIAFIPADWQPTAVVVGIVVAAIWFGSRPTEKDEAIKREQEAQARHEIEMAEIRAQRAAAKQTDPDD